MKLRKSLPVEFQRRLLVVSTKAYRRYLLHSLSKIHADLFGVVEEWVAPGMTVWDVGANCGMFTFPAAIKAGAGGRVFSFEPDLSCATLMKESQQWRRADEGMVVLCPWAISDKNGTTSFSISSYRTAANSLAGFGRFSSGGRLVTVPTFTLDCMLEILPPPDLVKVDVEGAEHLVLRGADGVFGKCRPVLVIEVSSGAVGEEIENFLRNHSYVWRGAVASIGKDFINRGMPSSDIVAVPSESPVAGRKV
jgi:FkbM family methyltransferase